MVLTSTINTIIKRKNVKTDFSNIEKYLSGIVFRVCLKSCFDTNFAALTSVILLLNEVKLYHYECDV